MWEAQSVIACGPFCSACACVVLVPLVLRRLGPGKFCGLCFCGLEPCSIRAIACGGACGRSLACRLVGSATRASRLRVRPSIGTRQDANLIAGPRECCLNPRSSGAPTACHAGHQALGLRPILRLLSSAPCRCRPLSRNRQRKLLILLDMTVVALSAEHHRFLALVRFRRAAEHGA